MPHSCASRTRFLVFQWRFSRKKETRRTNRGNGQWAMISNWLAVFGAPDILVVDKDKRFIGEIPQDFCTYHNIVMQTVIPRHHQSLGATERRRVHFRGIIDHIICNRKSNCLSSKEWKEFSAMTALHLNSQVQQYGGFTPGSVFSAERLNYR